MPTVNAAPLAGVAARCQPDARLVALCREGHERAFDEIVRRYRQALVSFAAAIVPADRAEDVVQEALTKAHSALLASAGEMRLKPWLYTIVRNRALNDLRDDPGHERLDDDFDGVPQPPEVAAGRAELAAVLAALKALPPAQREALVRRELEGRSHDEIAAAIGTTPGAVRGLIFRARTAMRNAVGALVPLPVLRTLLNAGPLATDATGVGATGAMTGLTAGGGGAIAIKTGAAVLIAGLAVGSGAALQNRGERREATAATVTRSSGPASRERPGRTGGFAPGPRQAAGPDRGGSSRGPGPGAARGDHGRGSQRGSSGESGRSGGERGPRGSSGEGPGGSEGSGHGGAEGDESPEHVSGGDDGGSGHDRHGGGTSGSEGENSGTGGDDGGNGETGGDDGGTGRTSGGATGSGETEGTGSGHGGHGGHGEGTSGSDTSGDSSGDGV